MLLAPMILSLVAGQACPGPSSNWGPPPCAASNVPGCLPGYRRQVDAYGRETYVCDPSSLAQARAPVASSPAPPFMAYAAPPPRYVPPPPSPSGWYGDQPTQRGLVGFVFMPGGGTVDRGQTSNGAVALQLELRPPTGGARLRFGYEYSRPVSVLDVSFKFDFLGGPISPFVSAGIGGAYLHGDLLGLSTFPHDQVWRTTADISGGIDLNFTPNVFASFELKQRAFAQDTTLNPSDLHQTSLFIGIGFFM